MTDNDIPNEKDAMHIDQIESAIHDAIYEHCKALKIPADIANGLIKVAVSRVDAHYNSVLSITATPTTR